VGDGCVMKGSPVTPMSPKIPPAGLPRCASRATPAWWGASCLGCFLRVHTKQHMMCNSANTPKTITHLGWQGGGLDRNARSFIPTSPWLKSVQACVGFPRLGFPMQPGPVPQGWSPPGEGLRDSLARSPGLHRAPAGEPPRAVWVFLVVRYSSDISTEPMGCLSPKLPAKVAHPETGDAKLAEHRFLAGWVFFSPS